jgi:hypothetical protein
MGGFVIKRYLKREAIFSFYKLKKTSNKKLFLGNGCWSVKNGCSTFHLSNLAEKR